MAGRARGVRGWLVGLLTGLLWPGVGLAVELTAGPATEPVGNSAIAVRWTTDVAAGGRVTFGGDRGRLDRSASGPVVREHRIVLSNLVAGARYRYTVGSARRVLATNAFVVRAEPVVVPREVSPPQPEPSAAPPTKRTWGHLASLPDHFNRHGRDFGAVDADDYARMAWEFRERGRREGLPVKRDADGVIRVFERKSGTFGAYNRDGTTRTFFKPGSRDYFERQPGQAVDWQTLKFK